MTRRNPHRNEKGAALVTVLMIVAAMSAIALGLSSAVLASTTRARSLDASAQADWLTLAAEEFGRSSITELFLAAEGRLFDGMPGLGEPIVFNVEGGQISVTGRDASNCFNVNAMRTASDGASQAANTPRDDYRQLLELVPDLEGDPDSVATSLIDWMDGDQTPGLNGAEDAFYSGPGLQYRTSGQPLADLSELRAIRFYSSALVAQLEPLLCALPDSRLQPLNLNTLTAHEAPLLSLALSGAITVEQARDLIFQRPAGGWESVDAFLEEPAIAEIAPDLRRTDLLGIQATYIDVQAAILYRGTHRLIDVLYRVDGADAVTIVQSERKG